uniref:Uncharacterized protein n=1 Tax=viral metagenome TaxID=1070528 RepID=A0A6C0LED3_9ZZZZ
MTSEDNNLHERLLSLENEVRNLKMGTSVSEQKTKKEKKPRAPTEYNKFVSVYINEQKEKLGSDFNHKVAFADAAKKWNEKKESKKEEKTE